MAKIAAKHLSFCITYSMECWDCGESIEGELEALQVDDISTYDLLLNPQPALETVLNDINSEQYFTSTPKGVFCNNCKSN